MVVGLGRALRATEEAAAKDLATAAAMAVEVTVVVIRAVVMVALTAVMAKAAGTAGTAVAVAVAVGSGRTVRTVWRTMMAKQPRMTGWESRNRSRWGGRFLCSLLELCCRAALGGEVALAVVVRETVAADLAVVPVEVVVMDQGW